MLTVHYYRVFLGLATLLCNAYGEGSSFLRDRESFNQKRDLSAPLELKLECPTIPPDVGCTYDYNPVKCGTNQCLYTNPCLASLVNFTNSDCELVEVVSLPIPASTNVPAVNLPKDTNQFEPTTAICPVSGSLTCTKKHIPVVCGANDCLYGNFCFAKSVNFKKSECKLAPKNLPPDTCPPPDESVFCIALYDPVQCGNCTYSNSCFAGAAGAKDCKAILPQDNNQSDQSTQICPDPGSFPCTKEYLLYLCGDNDCRYDNLCLAQSANFTESECKPACPIPDESILCIAEYAPVECGEYSCLYSNSCFAGAANFTAEDCTGIQPTDASPSTCPEPDGRACTEEYRPVVCGENACWYENPCYALASGFEADECEVAKDPAFCPLPETGFCTTEYIPVVCGENECIYGNQCEASLAGFVKCDCALLEV